MGTGLTERGLYENRMVGMILASALVLSACGSKGGEQRRHQSDTPGAGKYRSHEIRNFQELSREQQDRYRRYHNGQRPIEHQQRKLLQLHRSAEAHHQL